MTDDEERSTIMPEDPEARVKHLIEQLTQIAKRRPETLLCFFELPATDPNNPDDVSVGIFAMGDVVSVVTLYNGSPKIMEDYMRAQGKGAAPTTH